MNLEWTPRLAVGVSAIDSQHAELLSRFSNLAKTLVWSTNKLEIMSSFRSLESHVVSHLETEEEAMGCYLYSGASSHRAEHAAFESELAALKERILDEAFDAADAIARVNQLVEWQLDHIGNYDYDLGRHLKTGMIVQRAA